MYFYSFPTIPIHICNKVAVAMHFQTTLPSYSIHSRFGIATEIRFAVNIWLLLQLFGLLQSKVWNPCIGMLRKYTDRFTLQISNYQLPIHSIWIFRFASTNISLFFLSLSLPLALNLSDQQCMHTYTIDFSWFNVDLIHLSAYTQMWHTHCIHIQHSFAHSQLTINLKEKKKIHFGYS